MDAVAPFEVVVAWAAMKRWLTIGLDQTGFGIVSPAMREARSSIWRWDLLAVC